jgi:hypothetical protein
VTSTSALPERSRFEPRFPVGLERCEQALSEHLEAVVRHHGPAALGVIDLPGFGAGTLVPPQIQVSAVLYWASEVERAGLLPFVEALAAGVVRGTIVQPLGNAVHELARMWRTRERRFSGVERDALFARIFGDGGAGDAFPSLFQGLLGSLMELGRAPRDRGIGHLRARIVVTARQLGGHLSEAGTGIAGFAARDIVAQVRAALRILQDPDLVRGMGGGSPWQIVARHAPRVLRAPVHPRPHLGKATAGYAVLDWVASEARSIEAGTVRLDRTAPVIASAEAWRAANGDG